MIKLYRAKKESRKRDLKRGRFILQVGKSSWHLSDAEVAGLVIQGLRALRLCKILKVTK